eukprot:3931738-Rhodomonas_salina.2
MRTVLRSKQRPRTQEKPVSHSAVTVQSLAATNPHTDSNMMASSIVLSATRSILCPGSQQPDGRSQRPRTPISPFSLDDLFVNFVLPLL